MIKESGGSTTVTCVNYRRDLPNSSSCPISVAGTYPGQVISRNYKRTAGHDIPNFHRRLRNGELLPFTSFWQWEDKGTISVSQAIYKSNIACKTNPTYWWSPHNTTNTIEWWYSPSPDPSYPTRIEALADEYMAVGIDLTQAAAASVWNQGWDALTFAAELKKTASMFRGFVSRFAENVAKAKPGNSWLEGRYGWRQIYFDMKDIEKLLNSLDDKRKRFKKSSGTQTSLTEVSSKSFDWSTCTITYSIIDIFEISARGSVVADIAPPKIEINPIKTGWELVTLSFVIDWVVNVGSWLDSMAFLACQTKYYAAGGVHITQYRTTSIGSLSWKPYHSGTLTHESQWSATLTARTPCTIPYHPLINVRIDAYKTADLVALLLQRVKRIKNLARTGQLLLSALDPDVTKETK